MKVCVSAASGNDKYPSITGLHEFESLDKAVDFVRYGAKGFDSSEGDDLILYFPKNGREGRTDGADVEIVIYDYWVE